jgi:hypothetical protein
MMSVLSLKPGGTDGFYLPIFMLASDDTREICEPVVHVLPVRYLAWAIVSVFSRVLTRGAIPPTPTNLGLKCSALAGCRLRYDNPPFSQSQEHQNLYDFEIIYKFA